MFYFFVKKNSTTEFRNAFLKTIRQIIRESVRNMSIPSTKQNIGQPTMSMAPRMSTGHVEKFDKPPLSGSNTLGSLSKKSSKQQILSNTLNSKRKHSHPKSSVEHESSEDRDIDEPPITQFRSRSKTISDTTGG